MHRRTFLHGTLMASILASLPRSARAKLPFPSQVRGSAMSQSPIGLADQASSSDFNGDDISRAHDILWDKEGYLASKGGMPPVTETVPLVIIGGGMSGLSSAYLLRDYKPVVLEGDAQFGGNSKGEKIGKTTYSIGAAYFVKPDAGSDIENFMTELSLLDQLKEEGGDETSVLFQGKVQRPFWQGKTDPKLVQDFQKVQSSFREILENRYPDIPYVSETTVSKDVYNQWDSMNFKQWLKNEFGSIHPHVEEYLELYTWSSFCGTLSEISAAQMLNFITSETGSIVTLPGGNAAITERLYQTLEKQLGRDHLRGNCFVIDITRNADGVRVLYEDGERNLKALQAKACVFAAAKFIGGKVISDMAEIQQKAIDQIDYRAYVVANVLMKKPMSSPTYDMYCLRGAAPEDPSALSPGDRQFTDVCFGSWVSEPQADRGVITVYKALPYDGARQFLFAPFAHDKNRKQVESQLPDVLQALSLKESDIDGIRMTRWGHALPVAKVGALANGIADRANRTIEDRIVFANQDNWLNPSFEVAFAAAQFGEKEIRRILG